MIYILYVLLNLDINIFTRKIRNSNIRDFSIKKLNILNLRWIDALIRFFLYVIFQILKFHLKKNRCLIWWYWNILISQLDFIRKLQLMTPRDWAMCVRTHSPRKTLSLYKGTKMVKGTQVQVNQLSI